MRKEIFGDLNLQVAVANEDLAYALYVHEYSSGHFDEARYSFLLARLNLCIILVLKFVEAKQRKPLIRWQKSFHLITFC